MGIASMKGVYEERKERLELGQGHVRSQKKKVASGELLGYAERT